jgi:metal-dependent hydrolase (beta-lactamase superfamily II)
MESVPLEPVDSLTVTTLVDNVTDLLLPDKGPAKRWPITRAVEPSIPARFLEPGKTGDALRGEHGFSCLVEVEKAGRIVRVLFDAGLTPDRLVENMRRLELDPRAIHEAHREGGWQPDPLILDDPALVANVRGRGIVVLTGCGHSGIVNIVRYVQKLTDQVRRRPLPRRLHPEQRRHAVRVPSQ